MSIETTKYIRKPLYVEAVQVTQANFEEIAGWCQGEILAGEDKGREYRFIQVRVTNPMNPRQAQARIGDWILTSERGYKVYTPKAFAKAFDEAAPELQRGVSASQLPLEERVDAAKVDLTQDTTLEEVEPGVMARAQNPIAGLTPQEIHAYYAVLAKDGRMTAEEAEAAAIAAIEDGTYVKQPQAPIGTEPMPKQPLPSDVETPSITPALPPNVDATDENVVYPTTPETTASPKVPVEERVIQGGVIDHVAFVPATPENIAAGTQPLPQQDAEQWAALRASVSAPVGDEG